MAPAYQGAGSAAGFASSKEGPCRTPSPKPPPPRPPSPRGTSPGSSASEQTGPTAPTRRLEGGRGVRVPGMVWRRAGDGSSLPGGGLRCSFRLAQGGAMPNPVPETAPPPPALAAEHFAGKLAFETDCADVHDA